MKKVLSAFAVLGAALVLLGAPVSAQTPANITATITASPSNPTAGTNVTVTGVFSDSVIQLDTSRGEPHNERRRGAQLRVGHNWPYGL